jgi:glucose/arabinose dehydrogenase
MKPVRFTQADLTRATKAVTKAGMRVAGVKVMPDGSILVLTDLGQPANDTHNPLDRVLRR